MAVDVKIKRGDVLREARAFRRKVASTDVVRTGSLFGPKNVELLIPAEHYIFSQATAVASVVLDQNGYYILPATDKFINDNGDCFTNESLKANYETFMGAASYVNHVQQIELATGFLADCVLRRRYLNDEGLFVYYVDCLIANHRDHKELCDKITLGQIFTLSMGCRAAVVRCSRCGQIFDATQEVTVCDHLANQRKWTFVDGAGIERKVGEILGNDEPGSIVFDELSWLTCAPAFKGSVARGAPMKIDSDAMVSIMVPEEVMERPAMKKYFPHDV